MPAGRKFSTCTSTYSVNRSKIPYVFRRSGQLHSINRKIKSMGSFSIWHWVVVLVVVVLIFNAKLRNVGEGRGGAVKEFKEGAERRRAPPTPAAQKKAAG